MWLRSKVEQFIPVAEDEKQLSEKTRQAIFRGMYGWPGKMVKVETVRNYHHSTADNYPHRLKITREYSDGSRSFSGDVGEGVVYSDPQYEVEAEMRDPAALRRATHVERVARRIKGGVALALVTLGLGSAITMGPEAGAQPAPGDGVQSCVTQ